MPALFLLYFCQFDWKIGSGRGTSSSVSRQGDSIWAVVYRFDGKIVVQMHAAYGSGEKRVFMDYAEAVHDGYLIARVMKLLCLFFYLTKNC